MILFFGNLFLALALPLAVLGAGLAIAARHGNAVGLRLSVAVVHALALVGLALASLMWIALATDAFELAYVAQYSSRTLPFPFKVAAFWAGSEGSLLLWGVVLALLSSFAVRSLRSTSAPFAAATVLVLLSIQAFFLATLLFDANPFAAASPVPADGRGLNILLQNALMCIHPPMLLTGYVAMAIPFAFMMAALISRDGHAGWMRLGRRSMTFAWLILSIGNILGSLWAYRELGWGGFWGWDPVENAAILPWFTATAFLHSSMATERFGLFKRWTALLAALSFFLTIFGTFLNRSGVVQSVHAFSDFQLGSWFLVFMAIIVGAVAYLLVTRWRSLHDDQPLVSLWSRENAFLLSNYLLVLIAFAILWGTLFPLVSEAAIGRTITMEPEFYNRMLGPLGLLLIAVMAIGPHLKWHQTNVREAAVALGWPVGVSLAAALLCAVAGVMPPYSISAIALAVFVVAATVRKFQQGGWKIRRHGGYLAHIGIACAFVATAGAAMQTSVDVQLDRGESAQFEGYRLQFQAIWQSSDAHKDTVFALVDLSDAASGRHIRRLKPAYNFYRTSEQPANEIDIFVNPWHDLYLVLGSYDAEAGWASFRIMRNPLMNFLWVGGFFILVGGLMILAAPKRATSEVHGAIPISLKKPSQPAPAALGLLLCVFVATTAFADTPPPGMPATATGRIEGVLLERTAGGKERPLADHPVSLEVGRQDELMIAIPKTTDAAGRFVFRFIDSAPEFSYMIGTTFEGNPFRSALIRRAPEEEVKHVRLVVGAGLPAGPPPFGPAAPSAEAAPAGPAASSGASSHHFCWPQMLALSLMSLIIAGFLWRTHVLKRAARRVLARLSA